MHRTNWNRWWCIGSCRLWEQDSADHFSSELRFFIMARSQLRPGTIFIGSFRFGIQIYSNGLEPVVPLPVLSEDVHAENARRGRHLVLFQIRTCFLFLTPAENCEQRLQQHPTRLGCGDQAANQRRATWQQQSAFGPSQHIDDVCA